MARARDTRATRTPRGTATTMEELLKKTGYAPRGLVRGQKVEGEVLEVNPKSLILDIGAKSEGLVIERELEGARDLLRTLSPGDKIRATVLVPEAESGQPLLSIKETAEEFAWKKFQDALKGKEEVEVYVDSSLRAGLNVSAFGLSGFIPTSHLGQDLVKNPGQAVGKTIKVKPIEVDKREQRLIFSEKAVSEAGLLAAQEKALKKVKKGKRYKGRVVGLTSFGVFVQIEVDGVPIDGLVHLSELSWSKVDNPEELVAEGEEVEVVVIGKGEGRLALSIKQTQIDPWKNAAKKYKPDQKVKGRISKVGDYGALVELEPGIEGLLHMSKIPAGVVLREAQEVECFIEEVDQKARRISLGMVLKEKPIGYK